MSSKEKGFGTLELLLTVVLVVAVAGVGYYIYHSNHKANATAAIIKSPPDTSGSSNLSTSSGYTANIQNELNNVNTENANSSQALSSANSSVNDQSTFTAY